METRVLTSLCQWGSSQWKGMDRICRGVHIGGGCLGNSYCLASSQPLSASCCSAMKPFSSVECSHRMQIEQRMEDTWRCRVSAFVDGEEMQPTTLMRVSRRRHCQRGRAGSRQTTKVRSFVDEATAHSADVELRSPSSVSERDHGEAGESDFDDDSSDEFRESDGEPLAGKQSAAGASDRASDQRGGEEGEEYGAGVKTIEADTSSDEYEDMRLGEKKDWSVAELEKLDLLRNYEFRHGNEKGVLVVQAMRVEHMKAMEELLVDSFAELMGGLLAYRPLLALTVRQYVRDRYSCLPDVVTLVGLYSPADDTALMGRIEEQTAGNWLVAGTVELSFSNAGHPDIPSGPAPPPGSPYLCNMAVSRAYRRRGLGRQLLKAAEKVAVMMGAQDLFLHCRLVDLAPLEMYKGAGYQIVATDSLLSLLTLQRRRHLMRKRLPELSIESTNGK